MWQFTIFWFSQINGILILSNVLYIKNMSFDNHANEFLRKIVLKLEKWKKKHMKVICLCFIENKFAI